MKLNCELRELCERILYGKITGMSAIAGVLLIIYGAGAAYFGWMELQHQNLLSHVAAYSTLGIGGALILAGLAHFVAPHKAFLMSVPLLMYFHFQVYIDSTHINADGNPGWRLQAPLIGISMVILWLSYRGYKAKQAAAAVVKAA